MTAVMVVAQTFNNCLGFEWGLWQHQTMWFAAAPKKEGLLNSREWHHCDKTEVQTLCLPIFNRSTRKACEAVAIVETQSLIVLVRLTGPNGDLTLYLQLKVVYLGQPAI
jgi:hypothetical protein